MRDLLRPATGEDAEMVWRIRNDPEVRAQSFQTDIIPWEGHQKWFQKKMRDDKFKMFVSDSPEGYIRLDYEPVISIAVSERGRGNGTKLLQEFLKTHEGPIHAFISPENEVSRKLFEGSGFKHYYDSLHLYL